jgi:hypothetical protein
MNFTPKYNALGLKNHLEENENSRLDFIDAILLNEINSLIENWQNINTIVINNETYYNISYSKLREQLPHLNYGVKKNNTKVKRLNEGISDRLKKGLRKDNLIKLHIDRKDNSKTYFKLTPHGNKFVNTRIETREGNVKETVRVTDNKPTNKNTKYKNINNERGTLSPFDFLITNYKDEINNIIKDYRLNNVQLELCINKFNKRRVKNLNVLDFKNYIINWRDNYYKNNNQSNEVSLSSRPEFNKIV